MTYLNAILAAFAAPNGGLLENAIGEALTPVLVIAHQDDVPTFAQWERVHDTRVARTRSRAIDALPGGGPDGMSFLDVDVDVYADAEPVTVRCPVSA